MQLCCSLNILWLCLSLGLEWKLTFSSPVAKFSPNLLAYWVQHLHSIILFKKITFIYLAVLGLHCCVWACSSCGYSRCHLQASHNGGFSCCGAQSLRCMVFSSCLAWAQQLWHTDLVALWHVGSSHIWDWTSVHCTARWIPNRWTTREALTASSFRTWNSSAGMGMRWLFHCGFDLHSSYD